MPGLYLPPVFKSAGAAVKSAPDDHFTAGPDCCVMPSGSGRVGGAGGCPTVGAGIVPPAGVQISRRRIRPRRSFRCRSTLLCDTFGQRARWWCWWLSNCRCWDCISRRCSKSYRQSAPDDHFTAGPDRRVTASGSGRVGGAGGCPTVGAGIVSPAGVQKAAVTSAPDDHFAAGPHCRVTGSGSGRVGGAGGCPTVGAGVVSSAGVKKVGANSSPPQTIISLPVQTAV